MAPITDFLKLSKGESVIKDYFVFKARTPQKMEGHIAVTNKRVILYGIETPPPKAENSILINEVNIDKVKGVDVFVSPATLKRKTVEMYLGFVYVFFGIAIPLASGGAAAVAGLLAVLGIFVIIFSFRKRFWINIKTTGIEGITITGSKHGGHIGGIKIGPDGVQFAQEIGALILSIQQGAGYDFESPREEVEETKPTPAPTPPTPSVPSQPQQQAPPATAPPQQATPKPQPALAQKPPAQIKCYKCGAAMTISSNERPIVVQCPECGAKGKVTE